MGTQLVWDWTTLHNISSDSWYPIFLFQTFRVNKIINVNYKPLVNFQVEVCPWQSSRHNMGMAFRKETWRGLSNCAEGFCSYDDYNWDWSLQRVSQECLPQTSRLKALVARGPRVFHIGEWCFIDLFMFRFVRRVLIFVVFQRCSP